MRTRNIVYSETFARVAPPYAVSPLKCWDFVRGKIFRWIDFVTSMIDRVQISEAHTNINHFCIDPRYFPLSFSASLVLFDNSPEIANAALPLTILRFQRSQKTFRVRRSAELILNWHSSSGCNRLSTNQSVRGWNQSKVVKLFHLIRQWLFIMTPSFGSSETPFHDENSFRISSYITTHISNVGRYQYRISVKWSHPLNMRR